VSKLEAPSTYGLIPMYPDVHREDRSNLPIAIGRATEENNDYLNIAEFLRILPRKTNSF